MGWGEQIPCFLNYCCSHEHVILKGTGDIFECLRNVNIAYIALGKLLDFSQKDTNIQMAIKSKIQKIVL